MKWVSESLHPSAMSKVSPSWWEVSSREAWVFSPVQRCFMVCERWDSCKPFAGLCSFLATYDKRRACEVQISVSQMDLIILPVGKGWEIWSISDERLSSCKIEAFCQADKHFSWACVPVRMNKPRIAAVHFFCREHRKFHLTMLWPEKRIPTSMLKRLRDSIHILTACETSSASTY